MIIKVPDQDIVGQMLLILEHPRESEIENSNEKDESSEYSYQNS
jgi:hypothetical protein